MIPKEREPRLFDGKGAGRPFRHLVPVRPGADRRAVLSAAGRSGRRGPAVPVVL